MKALLCGICIVAASASVFAEDRLLETLRLDAGESIQNLFYPQNGRAYAVLIKKGFSQSWIYYKGKRQGPFASTLYEAFSDDGSALTFLYEKGAFGPKSVLINNAVQKSWDGGVEYLGFIPGTATVTYKGGTDDESYFVIIGDKSEGPYRTAGAAVFSSDGKHHFYQAKTSNADYKGDYFLYLDGQKKYGPYALVYERLSRFLENGEICYTAEAPDGQTGVYISGRRIAAHEKIGSVVWNPRIKSPALSYQDKGKLFITDGVKTFGPYEGSCQDMAFSRDGKSFCYAVGGMNKSVSVYKDEKLIATVDSVCSLNYSPDGSTVAFSTAHLGGANYVSFNEKKYGDYDRMVAAIHFTPDGRIIVYKAYINKQVYIISSVGLCAGPYSQTSEPVISSDGTTVSFLYVQGNGIHSSIQKCSK